MSQLLQLFLRDEWTPPDRYDTDWKSTNMVWHWILVVCLPIAFLLNAVSLVQNMHGAMEFAGTGYAGYYWFDVIMSLLMVVINLLAFLCMLRKQWTGPRLLVLRAVVSIFYSVCAVVLYLRWEISIASELGQIVGGLVFLWICIPYYNKRRPLFSPQPAALSAVQSVPAGAASFGEPARQAPPVSLNKEPGSPSAAPGGPYRQSFCTRCGARLSPGAAACSVCGASTFRAQR